LKKQSQFDGQANSRKLSTANAVWRFWWMEAAKKQTQFKADFRKPTLLPKAASANEPARGAVPAPHRRLDRFFTARGGLTGKPASHRQKLLMKHAK